MCTFCLHYIKLIIEKYGWKYIPLATTNVYITKYVVWLKAIAFKECPAPTCTSEHHDSMKYHTLEQKILIGKDPDAGKDWRQEEKGTTENGMVGWHYWVNGHEFEQAPGLVMDREVWRAAVHGIAKCGTRLNWTESKKQNPWIKRNKYNLSVWERPDILTLMSWTRKNTLTVVINHASNLAH